MAIAGSRRALIIVLVIVGLYFLIDHTEPLPFNHEAVGIGKLHVAHAVFGIVLIAAAFFIYRKSRRIPVLSQKAQP